MEGYVLNSTNNWTHAMKRSIGPGGKIPLAELFEQYGTKHSLTEGDEFISWLQNVKLKDRNKWKIVLEDDNATSAEESTKSDVKKKDGNENVAPMVHSKMEVSDVVEMSVRQAREVLPKVNDLVLLRYALQEANQRAGKDSLCKIIRKRINDLKIAR